MQADALERLTVIDSRLARIQAVAEQGSVLRNGLQVILMGRPNVGKSSLLNRLAGEELAIVTPHPGTTRDSVRGEIQLEGVPIHIVDTAGLRASPDEIERLGMRRTWEVAAKADLALVLLDATQCESEEDQAILAQLPPGLKCVRVWNKIDLREMTAHESVRGVTQEIFLSAKTGAGIELLRTKLLDAAGWHATGEDVFVARARHLEALRDAQGHLMAARENASQLELFAEELRLAHASLGTITGQFTADDLLGEIFAHFCVGK